MARIVNLECGAAVGAEHVEGNTLSSFMICHASGGDACWRDTLSELGAQVTVANGVCLADKQEAAANARTT